MKSSKELGKKVRKNNNKEPRKNVRNKSTNDLGKKVLKKGKKELRKKVGK